MSSIGGSNSGEGGVVGYLICTQQGLPLLSKQFYTATSSSSSNSHSTTHSSSHWKSVAQYICLSAGFWTSKSAPFSFVLSTYTYFVTVLTCEDQLLYSCVEVVTSSQASQKYPALLSYYLGWRLIRHCHANNSTALSRLLHDIHQKTEEVLREGTFSDSIGTNQDEFWEEFLSEHEIHDHFMSFEEQYVSHSITDLHAEYLYIFKTVGSAIYNGTFSMYYVSPDERQQTLFPLATSIFADGQIVASLDMSYSSPWKLRVEALLRRDMLQDSDRCSASIWQHDELTDYCAIYFSAQHSILVTITDIRFGAKQYQLKSQMLDDFSMFISSEFPDPITDVIELLIAKYVDSCFSRSN